MEEFVSGEINVISYVRHQPVRQGQTTTTGTLCSTLLDKCVLTTLVLNNHLTLKMRKMGPLVYIPYWRVLELVTTCRCHCKRSTLSSVTL